MNPLGTETGKNKKTFTAKKKEKTPNRQKETKQTYNNNNNKPKPQPNKKPQPYQFWPPTQEFWRLGSGSSETLLMFWTRLRALFLVPWPASQTGRILFHVLKPLLWKSSSAWGCLSHFVLSFSRASWKSGVLPRRVSPRCASWWQQFIKPDVFLRIQAAQLRYGSDVTYYHSED